MPFHFISPTDGIASAPKRAHTTLRCFQVAVGAFLVLSVADLILTWKLVALDDNDVAEINPVACWILQSFGWSGMAAYKATLVAAIVATISAIRARRRRAGDAVMTFGCGAQAAIVMTGILLWNGKDAVPPPNPADHRALSQVEDDFAELPPRGWWLLNHKGVQQELGLSSTYLNDMLLHHERIRAFRRRVRNQNAADSIGSLAELAASERSLSMWLTPVQRQRLGELSLQLRGMLALADDKVVAALELTPEQALDAFNLVVDSGYDVIEAENQGRSGQEVLERAKERIWKLLQEEQQSAWRKLLGAPFDFAVAAAPDDAFLLDGDEG